MSFFHTNLPVEKVVTPTTAELRGSMILGIAAQVRKLQSTGRAVCNLTVGDFRPSFFPIPQEIAEEVQKAYRNGQTNYPPADGVPELKEAISTLYKNELGLDYGVEGVCVASGARPPLFATWMLFVSKGDKTISFLPAWNNGYYAHMFGADHRFIPTTAENNFHPVREQIEPYLSEVKLIAINSPLNPTGTVISEEALRGICEAIVEENEKRIALGKSPVVLQFDQVYWMLREKGVPHVSPAQLVPEIAPYVIHIDAISKSFAATGLRVGWSVTPAYLQGKMKAVIGHMGAWAARPEQMATAWFLNHPEKMHAFLKDMQSRVSERLQLLYQGVTEMKSRGLPVDAIQPQGAIYMSFHVDLIGKGQFQTNEDIRHWLLEKAAVAVVPFQAFDMKEDSGWFRMSVGAANIEDLSSALSRIEKALLELSY